VDEACEGDEDGAQELDAVEHRRSPERFVNDATETRG
jgi:hypothetical protein